MLHPPEPPTHLPIFFPRFSLVHPLSLCLSPSRSLSLHVPLRRSDQMRAGLYRAAEHLKLGIIMSRPLQSDDDFYLHYSGST